MSKMIVDLDIAKEEAQKHRGGTDLSARLFQNADGPSPRAED
jgi:hypothetical protein